MQGRGNGARQAPEPLNHGQDGGDVTVRSKPADHRRQPRDRRQQEALATLESLRSLLSADGIEALGYQGDLPLVERDRQVARFRDPEGPKVLISTEVGGEGRNFQFAHHLVNYDLPWSPATMEQLRPLVTV